MTEFMGKVALVTGASSGIGRAVATALARQGARVVLAARSAQALEETAQELGSEVAWRSTDVSCEDQVASLVEFAVSRFGRLDLAFNNAGSCHPPCLLHELSAQEFLQDMNVNAAGVFYCLKHEIPLMLSQGEGVIVNDSSINGLSAVLGKQAGYTASKFAIEGLTRTAALDYAERGIRVNAVAPAGFPTPMLLGFTNHHPEVVADLLPMKRVPQMHEIVDVVLWLLSSRSSFVTGQTIAVDGGFLAR